MKLQKQKAHQGVSRVRENSINTITGEKIKTSKQQISNLGLTNLLEEIENFRKVAEQLENLMQTVSINKD